MALKDQSPVFMQIKFFMLQKNPNVPDNTALKTSRQRTMLNVYKTGYTVDH